MKKGWKQIPIGGIIDKPATSKEYKTGTWKALFPEWHSEKCIQCLICALNCPDNSITVKDGKRDETNLDYCKGCGLCAAVCPVKCIEMKEESRK